MHSCTWCRLSSQYGTSRQHKLHKHPSGFHADIVRSDFALDKQKGCRLASHPDMMLELQREKAAQVQQVLLKEQLSDIYSDVTLTGRRSQQRADIELTLYVNSAWSSC